MASRLVLRGLVLAVFGTMFAGGVASAQTGDFTLLATVNGSSSTIPNDSTLPFLTTVGTKQVITVIATLNSGASPATITQTPQQGLSGSTEFTITSNLTPPQTFTPGQSFTMVITYSPANANEAGAVLVILYTQPIGAGGAPVQNAIELALQGTAPNFVLSYILESTKNGAIISSGQAIPFGPTPINTPAQAELTIGNSGSGAGFITGITQPPAGSPFVVEGIPGLSTAVPFPVTNSAPLNLVVQYTPTAVENDTAQIVITYQGGATATVLLTGNGITSTFTYKYVIQGVSTTVASGGTIKFPPANVGGASGNTSGDTSSLIVTVTNTGIASGTISSVSLSGQQFTFTGPVVTPATLTTGLTFSVPLTFTPTQVGTQTGQLQIGNAFFTLSGQGLGTDLTYAYASNGVSTAVTPTNPAVIFNPVAVGQSESVTFTVTNLGLIPATISLVGTSTANGPFTVPTPPALPAILAAGKTLSFPITFTPTTTGISSGALMVNTTLIPLEGNASAPTPLPSYTISGPSGTVAPATQANISLTLSKGYSLDVTGVLTLTTGGSFGTDPAVQFAIGSTTGNRTVDFTIPAGTTSADFAGQGSQLQVQTGTVAETVTLAPTFATTGGANLTPSSPPTLQFTIPSEVPVLVTAQIGNETTNSFDLVLTGYSTNRNLASLNVTFTGAAGFNVQTSLPAISLSQVSTAWFSSTASEAFGGQFTITMPFTLQGTVPKGDTLIQSIATVTATVSNSIGTSLPQPASVE
jgi:hypothetical protein